jgi:hypothetical protein
MGDVIWGTLFLHAPFKLSTKRQAMQFLEKHRRTYLVSFDVPAAMEMIKQSPEPKKKSRILAVLLPGRALPAFRPRRGSRACVADLAWEAAAAAFLCRDGGFLVWFRLPSGGGRGLARLSILLAWALVIRVLH